jgi:hypothetical protein
MGVLKGLNGNFMKKASVLKIVIVIFLTSIGGFHLVRSGSSGSNEETSVTTEIVTSSIITSTTTLATTTSTTIDPNATPVPGSCLVLEERYCQSGKVESLSDGGSTLGLELPVGTPIFSPFEGDVAYLFGESGKALIVSVSESESSQTHTFDVLITVEERKAGENYITVGEVIARAGKSNFSGEGFKEYNVALAYSLNGIQSATNQDVSKPNG